MLKIEIRMLDDQSWLSWTQGQFICVSVDHDWWSRDIQVPAQKYRHVFGGLLHLKSLMIFDMQILVLFKFSNVEQSISQIEYFNNKIICDLVEVPHKGVLAILDEACLNVGKVTDEMFLDSLSERLGQHEHFDTRKVYIRNF